MSVVVSSIKSVMDVFNMNPATLSGAIDVVAVRDEHGQLVCTPWHVRFGKLQIWRNGAQQTVRIFVNDEDTDLRMFVGQAGVAYFDNSSPTEPADSRSSQDDASTETETADAVSSPPHSLTRTRSASIATETLIMSMSPDRSDQEGMFEMSLSSDRDDDDHAVPRLHEAHDEPSFESLSDSGDGRASSHGPRAQAQNIDIGSPSRWRQHMLPTSDLGSMSAPEFAPGLLVSPPCSPRTEALVAETKALGRRHRRRRKYTTPSAHGSGTNSDTGSLAVSPRASSLVTSSSSDARPPPVKKGWSLFGWFSSRDNMPSADPATGNSSDNSHHLSQQPPSPLIEVSACAEVLAESPDATEAEMMDIFDAHIVSANAYADNPIRYVTDTTMLFRYDGHILTWSEVVPAVFGHVIYGMPLREMLDDDDVDWDDAPDAEPATTTSTTAANNATPDATTTADADADADADVHADRPDTAAAAGGEGEGEGEGEGDEEAPTNTPTAAQLESLPLRPGKNTIRFEVDGWRGVQTQTAFLYLWSRHARVVISDIDGTITRSDVLGQVLPMLGGQWAQSGVTELFTSIVEHGYNLLYLSSRAIGQSGVTRRYINWVQENGVALPEGPVLMSPDRLFTSFHREVIRRKPEEFKIACLEDLRRIFGKHNPFHAGFGNRLTDAISYKHVGVPPARIFIINPAGEIEVRILPGYSSSYRKLNELKNEVFPDLKPSQIDDIRVSEAYNEWNFWKL